MPKVSIIMPVYNSEKYVGEAIQSILDQTFEDYELIVIDDCCKDKSAEIISGFEDDRIVFVRNEENKGFLYGLNLGIEKAKGEYIARLDDDDTSYPERLAKQVEYMDAYPDVVLLGTKRDLLINNERVPAEKVPIFTSEEIAFSLPFGNYLIAHSSFMIRKSVLMENNIRYELFKQTPDHHMQLQLCPYGKINCLDEILVTWRIHPQQSTQVRSAQMKMGEEDRVRCIYIDEMPLTSEARMVLKKAVCRDLLTKHDYQLFKDTFKQYAEMCGLSLDSDKDLKCMQYVWKDILAQQKHNMQLFKTYISVQWTDWRWLLTTKFGIVFIIKCIISYNKRWFPAMYNYNDKRDNENV